MAFKGANRVNPKEVAAMDELFQLIALSGDKQLLPVAFDYAVSEAQRYNDANQGSTRKASAYQQEYEATKQAHSDHWNKMRASAQRDSENAGKRFNR